MENLMDKLNKWIKKSNEWDARQITKIKNSKYYHHLIDLESFIIFFTIPVSSLMFVVYLIYLNDLLPTEGLTIGEEFVNNVVAWVSGIILIYWQLFRILPFALKKDREAKKLRREWKEKKANN